MKSTIDKGKSFNESDLMVMAEIEKKSNINQRALAKELNISLGKINYCLKALKLKGLIKIKNFRNSNDKMKYLYFLTPKGIAEKTNITIRFMKLKMREYDELKIELNSQKLNVKKKN